MSEGAEAKYAAIELAEVGDGLDGAGEEWGRNCRGNLEHVWVDVAARCGG